MDKDKAGKRIIRLRDEINDYRYNYHVLNKSIMSEAAADSLKHELSLLEASYPELITPDSPTQRVAGAVLERFNSIAHNTPMLSLNDVFDYEELQAWIARAEKLLGHEVDEFFVEIKKDGLAGAVVYRDGVMIQGLTRGDGQVGEDITQNMKTIETLPLSLRKSSSVPASIYNGRFEVRGEILMYKKDFEQLNAEKDAAGQQLFANPRNTAAGTIRQLDSQLVQKRNLRFMVYIVETDVEELKTLSDKQNAAKELGMLVEEHGRVVHKISGIKEFIEEWAEKRHDLEFGTDGIVITINNNSDYKKLGVVGKAPRGAVAFKYPAEQTTTILKDIMISIGRTGAATPFAVLEPVSVAGSTISLATLHNESEIQKKDIRIGDTVIVQKAGDIIPEVVESIAKLRDGSEKVFEMPKNCPVCGEKLAKTEQEAVWRCINFDCPAQESGRIIHFSSKAAYDIEGLGEQTVDALLDAKLITDIADLFTVTTEELLSIDRFAKISAEKLVRNIASKKTISLDRFIYALGIRHVGQKTSRDLADFFGSLEHFRNADAEELSSVAGIGVVVTDSLISWLSTKRHTNLIDKLVANGVIVEARKRASGPLVGQTFVITGSLSLGSRDEVVSILSDKGGSVADNVTKNTTYLVIGEDPGASKISKADKLGTRQIDESELARIIKTAS